MATDRLCDIPQLDTDKGRRIPQELTAEIELTLADFLNREIAVLADVDPAVGAFARTARDAVLTGGKRLRPRFAYWGWRGIVGTDTAATSIMPALASLELLHAFALVHDDVMDRSRVRRGRPTVHQVHATAHTEAGRRGDPDHFGTSAAVLAGDLCLIWADRLMSATAVPPAVLHAARVRYDQMRIEAVAGQYLDVLGETDPRSWTVERALCVAQHKTASYTVLRPLQFGAALAIAPAPEPYQRVVDAYERYGLAVGEAFQLRDDLLGVYGDPGVTGKSIGDDLRTGKPTVLIMLALELSTGGQRTELRAGLDELATAPAGHDDGGDTAGRLRVLIEQTGAVARVEEMIRDRAGAALAALDQAPIAPEAREALRKLALAATQRRA